MALIGRLFVILFGFLAACLVAGMIVVGAVLFPEFSDLGAGPVDQGALNIVVTGTTFKNNTASNGGAIGTLNTTLTLANCLFDGNKANGNGGNTINSACTVNGLSLIHI